MLRKINYFTNNHFDENSNILVVRNIFLTNIVVFLSWIIFRSENLDFVINYYQILFSFFDGSWSLFFDNSYLYKLIVLFILTITCLIMPNSYEIINYKYKEEFFRPKKFIRLLFLIEKYYLDLIFIVILITYYVRFSFENKPFIYYQF